MKKLPGSEYSKRDMLFNDHIYTLGGIGKKNTVALSYGYNRKSQRNIPICKSIKVQNLNKFYIFPVHPKIHKPIPYMLNFAR